MCELVDRDGTAGDHMKANLNQDTSRTTAVTPRYLRYGRRCGQLSSARWQSGAGQGRGHLLASPGGVSTKPPVAVLVKACGTFRPDPGPDPGRPAPTVPTMTTCFLYGRIGGVA